MSEMTKHTSAVITMKDGGRHDSAIDASVTKVSKSVGSSDTNYEALIRDHLQGFRRVFPGTVGRELVRGEVEMARTEIDFRLTQLKAMRNAENQAMVEAVNAWLESGKIAVRKRLSDDFIHQFLELQHVFLGVESDFEAYIRRSDAQIARTENQALKKLQEEKRNRDMKDFYDTIEQLTDRFVAILSERIDSSSGEVMQPRSLKES